MKQLVYCINTACSTCHINEHPETQMEKLGFKIIASVPQSVYDCWWFTVEDYEFPLPEYIKPFNYDFDYWHSPNGNKVYSAKNYSTCAFASEDELIIVDTPN